jgi:hypothetical protein
LISIRQAPATRGCSTRRTTNTSPRHRKTGTGSTHRHATETGRTKTTTAETIRRPPGLR